MRKFKIEHRNETSHFSQSQTQHSQYTLQSKEKHFDQYLTCQPYPRQITSSFMYSIVGMNFAYLGFVGAAFLVLVGADERAAGIINGMIQSVNDSLLVGLIGGSMFVKVIIVTTILLDWRIHRDHKIHKILMRFTEYAQMYLRVLVELDFMSSSFLLITETAPSMVNFSISVLIIGFSVIFLENYSSRKDEFFIGSVNFHLLLRLQIVIGSITNFICLSIDESQIAEYCFLSVHTILAIIMVVAYLNEGFIIYRSGLLKWGVFAQNVVYFSLASNMLFAVFSKTSLVGLMLNTTLTSAVIAHFLFQKIQGKKLSVVTARNNMELEIFELLQMLEESHSNDEISSFLDGCLALHHVNQCPNPNCFTHLGQIYDSKARTYCSVKDIHNDRISLTKFYIKCKFESFLHAEPQNFDVMLSYAEFLYHQFQNIGLSLYWVRQVIENRNHLCLSSTLKLNGLIRKIREDNSSFCRTLYGSNFVIQELIQAQQTNKEITRTTFEILHEKIDIWKLIQVQEIDISLLRSKSESVMRKIDTCNTLWMGISHYVQMSKHWKFQYLCFAIFLKNQRLKNKILEDFDTSITSPKEKIFDVEGSSSFSVDLFDLNSCCIHAELREDGMFIKRASKNFPKLTDYSLQEMRNCNISVLMPTLIAKKHEEMLTKYSRQGKLSNEEYYSIKQVHIINKRGHLVPVVKLYKEYATLQGELEYICFLKRINDQECILLCNENFEITAFTERCRQMITDQVDDDIFLKNINLISLVPELAKYSKFQKFVGAVNLELPDFDVHNTLTQLVKERIIDSSDQQQETVQADKANNKLISNIKSTVFFKFIYPESSLKDYTYAYQTYQNRHGKYSLENYYQCINAITNKIQQTHHNSYSCCIAINEVNNSHGMRYYQVKLTKIRGSKPINSMFLIPRGKEETNNKGSTFVTASEMPKQVNIAEEGKTKVPSNLNIFIKQDCNLAPKYNLRLNTMKTIWIVYFLLITFLMFLYMNLLQSQLLDMVTSVRNIESTGRVSIISSRMINLYICKILNIPGNTAQITTLTQSIEQRMSSASMRTAFFDPQINMPQIYYPIDNKTTGYNEIDFMYFMVSTMRTLASNTTKINMQLYNTFMSYQFPSFNNLINHTNINLNIAFNNSEEIIDIQYMFTFTLEGMILMLVAILLLVISYRFYGSMIEMVRIHCHFNQKDIAKIIRYGQGIIGVFRDMGRLDAKIEADMIGTCSKLLRQHSSQKEEPQEKCNLNKRTKKISVGKRINRDRVIYFVKIMVCIVLFMALTVGRNEYLHNLVYPLVYLQVVGQNYLNFLPTNYLTAQIVAQAYSSKVHPTFNATQYQSLLSNLNIISTTPYVGSTTSDPISVLIKQFLYTDACAAINKDVLRTSNSSIEECRSVANFSFKSGLRQYSKYQLDITQKIISSNYIPTLSELKDYFRSVDIYHILNKNIVDMWIAQYNTLTTSTLSTIQLTTLLHFFLLLLILLFFRFHIYPSLKRQYTFYRFFYNHMMPEYIISLEKIIRSNLAVINFL